MGALIPNAARAHKESIASDVIHGIGEGGVLELLNLVRFEADHLME
jgi:hypothetical protein